MQKIHHYKSIIKIGGQLTKLEPTDKRVVETQCVRRQDIKN